MNDFVDIPVEVVPLTDDEVEAGETWNAGWYEREVARVDGLRQAAFSKEADPLNFEWQAGEGTKEAWLAKRAEIRERYPYPEPPK